MVEWTPIDPGVKPPGRNAYSNRLSSPVVIYIRKGDTEKRKILKFSIRRKLADELGWIPGLTTIQTYYYDDGKIRLYEHYSGKLLRFSDEAHETCRVYVEYQINAENAKMCMNKIPMSDNQRNKVRIINNEIHFELINKN